MAAPTISAYSNSNFADQTSGNDVTGSVSWTIGDVVVILGVTEDNTNGLLNTPTAGGTGLSFSAISGFPTNTASNCKVYAWSAVASASSSGAMTATRADTNTACRALAVWVFSGSAGIGNVATQTGDTTDPYTASLTRAGNNSAVVMIAGDWNAVSDTTTDPSPLTGSTQRVGDNGGFFTGVYNGYAADWSDEGAAGTTSYGITGVAAGKFTIGVVEVKGTVASLTAAQMIGIFDQQSAAGVIGRVDA